MKKKWTISICLAGSVLLASCQNQTAVVRNTLETSAVTLGAEPVSEAQTDVAKIVTPGVESMPEVQADASKTVTLDGAADGFVDSTYQAATGYGWQDLYVIMLLAIQTTPQKGENQPAFALFTLPGEDSPFLLTGLTDAGSDSGAGVYYLYVMNGENLYQLLQFSGTLLWDSEKAAFYIPEKHAWYTYYPHALFCEEASSAPISAKAISLTPLMEDSDITVENIGSFVQEVGR